jgi:hypothetical protein
VSGAEAVVRDLRRHLEGDDWRAAERKRRVDPTKSEEAVRREEDICHFRFEKHSCIPPCRALQYQHRKWVSRIFGGKRRLGRSIK